MTTRQTIATWLAGLLQDAGFAAHDTWAGVEADTPYGPAVFQVIPLPPPTEAAVGAPPPLAPRPLAILGIEAGQLVIELADGTRVLVPSAEGALAIKELVSREKTAA